MTCQYYYIHVLTKILAAIYKPLAFHVELIYTFPEFTVTFFKYSGKHR